MINLLWKYFPKRLKRYLFPSTIVLSIISTIAYLFISNQKIVFSYTALLKLLIVFAIYFIIIISVGTIIAYNRIIYYLFKLKDVKAANNHISIPEKKYLPLRFELEVFNSDSLEYTIFITRKWYPNEARPGVESFLNEIYFSEPRCGKCHGDFYELNRDYLECVNPDCNINHYSYDIKKLNERLQILYKGKVRNDYDKYWDKYQEIYDKFTNKKYDEYYEPSH